MKTPNAVVLLMTIVLLSFTVSTTKGNSKMPVKAFISQAGFKQEMLKAHNDYRALHGAQSLTIDPSLNKLAQKWANTLAKQNIFKHSSYGYGENLAMGGLSFPPKSAVDMWYGEIKKYNFNRPRYQPGTGHFTQVVWNGSTKVGFGRSVNSKKKKSYIVAMYDPRGNVKGAFAKNVFRLKKKHSNKGTDF